MARFEYVAPSDGRAEKFTRGPWEFREEKPEYLDMMTHNIVGPDKENIAGAICYYASKPETKANAYLIAAAPELYEALEKVRKRLSDAFNDGTSWMDTEFEIMDAALAKARGEAP